MPILGISSFYHDSAAVLLSGGRIVAAAQEERFSRKKHDSAFPKHAIRCVLNEACIDLKDLTLIAYYEKPFLKFERLLETYHAVAPRGLKSFSSAMASWIKEKLFIRKLLRSELSEIGPFTAPIVFPEHHLSHAASAFFPSPFTEAAILTVDGVGEWATTTIGKGEDHRIRILRELNFPHSIGLLYSAFTYYCGFKVNSGEYKLMGLAPYGTPDAEETIRIKQQIKQELVDIREDGSFILNMDYFDFAAGFRMCRDEKWRRLFQVPRREPETALQQIHMNMALAIQEVTEEMVMALATTTRRITGCANLVMAGGVALNCVANGKLLRSKLFENIWIQPAAGDAGGALGAAYAAYHVGQGRARNVDPGQDSMQGALLGPAFSEEEVVRVARRYNAPYREVPTIAEMCRIAAELIASGKVVGWFQGRMEYGPRALGNRSILGNPCLPEMQKKLNLKIKYREGFRPFAPAVSEEDVQEYFDLACPSPYMLLVAPVCHSRRNPLPPDDHARNLLERLYHLRSDIPAVTHVDYSARIQSVNKTTHPVFWALIKAFQQRTGYALLVNTSFNVRGEPIVGSPLDAYRCFMRTEMDCLAIGRFLFEKAEQPPWQEKSDWREKFTLD